MSLPRAYGQALGQAAFRQSPADFEVEELLSFEADGEGPQQLLTIRKTGANTAYVAGLLARHAGVHPRDVGYSGLKDRHAVATQYYSLPQPRVGVDWSSFSAEGVEILAVSAHRRKLRRGSHQGNRFRIRLVQLNAERDALQARLAQIARGGFPNYFGEQRFGRSNRAAYQRLLAGDRRLSRDQRGFALSALRSEIFNRILAIRVANGSWDQAQPGEPLLLDGRGSWFVPDALDEEISERLRSGQLHPSGALAGHCSRPLQGLVAEMEAAVLAEFPGCDAVFQRLRVDADRRALRACPRGLTWDFPQADQCLLEFELARGCFATALLQELFELTDLSQDLLLLPADADPVDSA